MKKFSMYYLIYWLTMTRSKYFIKRDYGTEFWNSFKKESGELLIIMLPEIPNIGDSLFSFNFKFGPAYIAWYKTFIKLGVSQEETINNIWIMNEKLIKTIPKSFRHFIGRALFRSMRKNAKNHLEHQNLNKLHPYDWTIEFRDLDKNSFEIDIKTCGLKNLAHDFEAEGLLPGICRMDYLTANLMGNGFSRTKTLGDGNDCCDGHYELIGECEWSPEKGFDYRK